MVSKISDHGQLWETLAKRLEQNGVEIKKEYKVININISEDNIIKSVECETQEGIKQIDTDILISSMPIKDLVKGIKGIQVPENIVKIAEGLPYRDFITAGLLVDKLNLENKTNIKTLGNIVPDCWIYVQEPEVKMCRLQIFNNWSPYLVKNPENTVWVGLEYVCQENDELWNMSDVEFKEFATKELEAIGIIEKQQVMDSHVERIKKAYPAYFDTYDKIDELIGYLNNFENLYCIGRNGQHRYNNMDHSMVTAIEAANNIINGIKTKNNIWEVNTEKEYHETKKQD